MIYSTTAEIYRYTVPTYAYAMIEKELEGLKNDGSLLRAFLLKAMMQKQSERSRDLDLERQIKEIIYDIEDIHESWLIAMAAKNTVSVAREIKSIRHFRLDPMLRMIRIYTDLHVVEYGRTKANEVPSVQLNKVVPPIGLNNMVGFEDEAKTLISCLVDQTAELDVISITGMPGIGKTTLAWKIYQDEMIRTEFPTRIWVDIPLDFCNKDLYVNILTEFLQKDMIGYQELVEESGRRSSYFDILDEYTEGGRINDHQLIHAVRAYLEKTRVLLVMDSVWTADTLQSIRHFLPNTSKVLITSRNNNVMGKPHVLRFLNEKESWELLQLEVFGKLNVCPDILRSTGERIAKSCDGSPLAIVAVGNSLMATSSTLAAKYMNEKLWKEVSENLLVYVTDYDQQCVFKSVELSWTELPQYMHDCFLYLGVFPEGHEIPVQTLTRLWIAERLVQDSWGLCLEEAAERILHDLINRNLVMVGKIYPNGNIKTCRLHKLIYGFCKYKAAEQEYYHEMSMSKEGALDCPKALTPSHRRLCMYSCLSEFLTNGPKGPCVRSILCFDKEDKVLHPNHSSNIHKSFKLLKILECKGIKFAKFPTKLSRLMNLRYISLSCDSLDAIPESISSLCYLETLVVDTKSPSLEFKANIWRMFQLHHLVTKAAIVLVVRGKGEAGQGLQTLTRLAPQCCTEDVFTRAPNLKMLGIRGQLAALSSPESLGKLECLQHLKLINESAAAPSDHQLQRLHDLIDRNIFPPNLRRLTLSATHLKWEMMSVLGKLDSLEILKLKNNAFMGMSWINTDADLFRRLGFLFIGTTDLVSWEAPADCFPTLKCLVLKNCEKLHNIPPTLENSLDTFDVVNVPNLAYSREILDIDDMRKDVNDTSIIIPFVEQPHPDAQVQRNRRMCQPLRPAEGQNKLITMGEDLVQGLEVMAANRLSNLIPDNVTIPEPVTAEALRFLLWLNWRHVVPYDEMAILHARLCHSFWKGEEFWAMKWFGIESLEQPMYEAITQSIIGNAFKVNIEAEEKAKAGREPAEVGGAESRPTQVEIAEGADEAELQRQRKGKGILVEPNKSKPVFPVRITPRGGLVIRTTPPSSPSPAHLTGPALKLAELQKVVELNCLQPDQPVAQQPSVLTMTEVSSAQAPKIDHEKIVLSQFADQVLRSTKRRDDDGSDEVDENIVLDQPKVQDKYFHINLKRTSLEEEDADLLAQTRASIPSFEKSVCPNLFLREEVELSSEEDLVKATENAKEQIVEQTSSKKEQTEKVQTEKKKSEASEVEKAKQEKVVAETVERAMQRVELGSLLAAECYSLLETDVVMRIMDQQLLIQMRANRDVAFTANEATFAKEMMAQLTHELHVELHDDDIIRYTNQCHKEEQLTLAAAREVELAKAQAAEASMSLPLALANGQPTQHAPLNVIPISFVHPREVEKDEEGEEVNQDRQLVVTQANPATQIHFVLTTVVKIGSMMMTLDDRFNSLSDVIKKGEEVRKAHEALLRDDMKKIQAETARRAEEAKLAELRTQQAENARLKQVEDVQLMELRVKRQLEEAEERNRNELKAALELMKSLLRFIELFYHRI